MTLIEERTSHKHIILSPSAWLGTFGSAKDPYNEALEVVESQGFFAFALLRLRMTFVLECHPERSEGSL
ncbi:MAG: hypothetical protein AMJ88_17495 [Anaerolineae bacterium SM23_ 63]|nr:MAG: hypothetical protein AMJ88_17495 [Anaerolineae bacterium SM23_ 63]